MAKGKPQELHVPISTALDQPVRLPALGKVLAAVESTMLQAARKHDPSLASGLLNELNVIGRTAAIGTAKALWMAKRDWEKICPEANNFEFWLFHKTGLAPDTVRRYIDVWDTLTALQATKQQVEALQQRPIADLIAISQFSNAHGTMSRDQVGSLAAATDSSEVRKLLREFRGLEPDANHIQLVLRNDGTLEAWQDGNVEQLGFLRVNTKQDPAPALRLRALNRLVKRAGIREE